MATMTGLRDGLKTRLDTISGLRAHDTIPGQVNPPAAIVMLDEIEYDESMSRGLDRYTFRVRVYVAATADAQSQNALDGYLASSGSNSIKAAIEGDRTLSGNASSVRVERASGYGVWEHGASQYLGAEWTVDVYATGT